MALSKSYSEALRGTINTRFKPVMDIFESHRYPEWTNYRNIALEILNHAKKLRLPLKIDNLTFGNGSCFMISVLQQCRRPEVKIYCQEDVLDMSKSFDTQSFRNKVSDFMLQSNHPSVLLYKELQINHKIIKLL